MTSYYKDLLGRKQILYEISILNKIKSMRLDELKCKGDDQINCVKFLCRIV